MKTIVRCDFCGKEKKIFLSRLKIKHHFCNMECQIKWQRVFQSGRGNAQWKGNKLARVCEYCRRTYKPQNIHSKCCSNTCRLEYLNEQQWGVNNPAWKGGTTPYRQSIEGLKEYDKWKIAVFKRDKYHCAMCGKNNKLNAHHIKTFAEYPKLRAILSNGITLCDKCHKKTYFKESLYEDRFYKTLSLIEDVYRQEIRLSFSGG